MEGINFVELQGKLTRGVLGYVGAAAFAKFKATLSIPMENTDTDGSVRTSTSYINIVCFGKLAEEFGEVTDGSFVRVQGVIQSRSYESPCKVCASPDKKYWTDVLVKTFVVLE